MAAGLGFKTWATGDVLTATDVNSYLMQGVWVFADAAARSAAVTSPQEGNFSYLKDTNKLYYYTGSAWAEADTTGIPASAFTAKGDLLVGTGSGTYDDLTVGGTNGHVLTVDSSTSTGLKWAAASSGGMTLISTTTANNDASVVISSIPTTYKNLQLVIRNLRGSVDNQDVRMRINGDTGSVYREMTGNDGGQSFNATFLTIGNGSDTATSNGLCFVNLVDYANTATWKIAQATYVNNNGDTTTLLQFKNSPGLLTNLTAAVTSLTIYMASGNVTAGTFLLYGVQ